MRKEQEQTLFELQLKNYEDLLRHRRAIEDFNAEQLKRLSRHDEDTQQACQEWRDAAVKQTQQLDKIIDLLNTIAFK